MPGGTTADLDTTTRAAAGIAAKETAAGVMMRMSALAGMTMTTTTDTDAAATTRTRTAVAGTTRMIAGNRETAETTTWRKRLVGGIMMTGPVARGRLSGTGVETAVANTAAAGSLVRPRLRRRPRTLLPQVQRRNRQCRQVVPGSMTTTSSY